MHLSKQACFEDLDLFIHAYSNTIRLMDDKAYMEALGDLELGELCFQIISDIEKDTGDDPLHNDHPDYALLRWIPAIKRGEQLAPHCYTTLRKRYEMATTENH